MLRAHQLRLIGSQKLFWPLARKLRDAGTSSQPCASARRGAPSASRQTPARSAPQLLECRWQRSGRLLQCGLP